jgi:hypothetical protein
MRSQVRKLDVEAQRAGAASVAGFAQQRERDTFSLGKALTSVRDIVHLLVTANP